jgi:lipopolysaccharide transport system permease protein
MTPKPKPLASEALRVERQQETKTHASQISRKPLFVVTPSHGWISLQLRSLWEYRELLYFLIWRDVKVRYKQTVFGLLWAVLPPLMTMVVFTIFFSKLGQVPSGE